VSGMFDLAVNLMRTKFLWLTCVLESERCTVWFDHSKKKRKLDFFLSDIDLGGDATSKDLFRSENLKDRGGKVSTSEEYLDCFKNVKLIEDILQKL